MTQYQGCCSRCWLRLSKSYLRAQTGIFYTSQILETCQTHILQCISVSQQGHLTFVPALTDALLITICTNVLGVRRVGVCPLPHLSQTTSVGSVLVSDTPGPGHIKISPFQTLPLQFSSRWGPQSPAVEGTIQTVGTGLTPSHSYNPKYVSPLTVDSIHYPLSCGCRPLACLPAPPHCFTQSTFRILNSGESSGSWLQAALAQHSAQRTSHHCAVAKINSNKFNI